MASHQLKNDSYIESWKKENKTGNDGNVLGLEMSTALFWKMEVFFFVKDLTVYTPVRPVPAHFKS